MVKTEIIKEYLTRNDDDENEYNEDYSDDSLIIQYNLEGIYKNGDVDSMISQDNGIELYTFEQLIC